MFSIVFSQLLQIFLLAAIILFIIDRFFAQPLKTISRYAEALDLDNLESPLVVKRGFIESGQDELGQVVHTLNAMRLRLLENNTDRLLVEESLRQSEAFRKRIFDSSRVPIVIMDAETFKYIDCNAAAVEIYRMPSLRDVIGKTPMDFSSQLQYDNMPSEEKARDYIQTALTNGSVVFEWRHQRTNGEIWDSEVHLMSFESNNRKMLQFTLQDITKRKRAEEELCENESRLRAIFESSQDAIGVAKNGMHIYANPAYLELFGFKSNDQILGTSIINSIAPPYREQMIQRVKRRSAGEDVERLYESRGLKTDGTEFDAEFSLSVYELHGEIYSVASIRDITEQKLAIEKDRLQNEQLQQADKMASLGILVSGVAHEVNNPNNFIMLNTPLLKDAWTQAEPILDSYYKTNGEFELAGIPYSEMKTTIPVLFQGIEDGSLRIKRIVEDLKNFARKDICNYENIVEVGQVIKEAISLLTSLINKKTNRFECIVPQNQVYIKGNKQKLEQVVINLIHNACDALESKDQAITVRLDVHDSECTISVADKGKGIPAPDLSHLTEPFFTSKRDSGGTGLGLSVSAGIIKEHNGRIQFESEVGKGTIVRIVLPVSFAKTVS